MLMAIIARFVENLLSRLTGPLKFRFLLQPAMAAFFAIRAGMADAKQGKPPYGWAVFTDKKQRKELLRNGWKDIGKLFLLAIVLDVIYQLIVLHTVYVGETIVVAFVLTIVPYFMIRGVVTRLFRRKKVK